ncbi:MAG: bifunctional homocysteine S-methyltransferase/methylenetetrahydrofolate reductase [Verrucomicrobia bacterium]|nr:bifunctional homocysteine S-methyltransferase/methylenetetrahydrofolate reductase [Verrucomicrobiota bacterium]
MPESTIIERMQTAPVVFDGAMGTVIYSRGVFINRCFDEVCLTDPELVRSVHAEYVKAGADVIETNTFGANRIWLQGYGLAEKTVEINLAGARLAREAAGDERYIAGSVGPCLRAGQLLTEEHRQQVEDAFRECTQALADGGVDFILLETFSNIDELLLAAEIAAETKLPIMASFTIDDTGVTARGRRVEATVPLVAASPHVDALGLNCGTGPAPLYRAAEKVIPLTNKPFVFMPNAGRPQEVEGRMLYLATPEYFTEYAKKFIELGARGVGGCCGTTPTHIQDAASAVHALSGVKQHIEIKAMVPKDLSVEAIPMASKSRFGGKLARGEKVTSIEISPPRSSDLKPMLERVELCHHAGIDAINIPDGPRASARISPMVTSIAIRQQVGIEPILHYCCRDRNLIGMQSDLLGSDAAGIPNLLIITGDPPKIGDYPDVTGVFDVDAIGLTQVATNLNHGIDIGGNPIAPPSGILIGVGVNPCAVEMDREMDRYRRKLEAGAEYAITQPVFDPEALFRFLDMASKLPKTIPVVAGIWPLVSLKNAEFMKNEVPGVEVPDSVIERMKTCKTREDGIAMGCEIAREIRDTVSDAVAGFQVSAPFGKVELAIDVLS